MDTTRTGSARAAGRRRTPTPAAPAAPPCPRLPRSARPCPARAAAGTPSSATGASSRLGPGATARGRPGRPRRRSCCPGRERNPALPVPCSGRRFGLGRCRLLLRLADVEEDKKPAPVDLDRHGRGGETTGEDLQHHAAAAGVEVCEKRSHVKFSRIRKTGQLKSWPRSAPRKSRARSTPDPPPPCSGRQ